jgi:hypothetical protein
VVLLVGLREYYRLRDDVMKWQGMPYPEARLGMEKSERDMKEARLNPKGVHPILLSVIPSIGKVVLVEARTDRRFAALRCVEAVRMYAAAHAGKPPAGLADVTEVPIPIDPVTGKPFEYKAEGNTFTVTGPTPAGEKPTTSNTLRYEVTIKQ